MEKVNNETGEVSKVIFKGMWNHTKKTGLDYSRKLEKRFVEVPPYATDIETGKILNKTSEPILMEDEPFDVDEYIQSFKDECDIYTILEKFALTGCTDSTLINKKVMSFGDISELPDNFNDLNKYFDEANSKIKEFKNDIAKDIIDDSKKTSDIVDSMIKADEAAKAAEAAKKVEVKKDE